MDGFVMDEEAERLVFVALVFHPIDALVRNQVCQIAFLDHGIIVHGDERRIVVITLTRQDFPMVKARGQAYQMPFADEGCLIPRLAKQLGHSLLGAVEHAGRIVREAVGMAMLARQHTGTAGTAQRIGHETIDEDNTVIGNTIQIGSLNQTAITAHHLGCMVVGHDVHDVVLLGRFFLAGTRSQRGNGGHSRQGVEVRGGQMFHKN